MIHRDHVALIRKAIGKSGGVWADFGSGDGAFTVALRDLAGPEVEIYSVDKDLGRLKNQKEAFEKMFDFHPHPNLLPSREKENMDKIQFLHADFTKPLDLPHLDGILMANSLHYVVDQVPFLRFIKRYLKPSGKLVLVEYNTDSGNRWVPYPLSFSTFQELTSKAGFHDPQLLATIPSSFLQEMYAAVVLAGE